MLGSETESVEERLRIELERARLEFEKAVRGRRTAMELLCDLDPTEVDGSFSAVQATREYARAFKRYREALTRWNRFIINRQRPPDILNRDASS